MYGAENLFGESTREPRTPRLKIFVVFVHLVENFSRFSNTVTTRPTIFVSVACANIGTYKTTVRASTTLLSHIRINATYKNLAEEEKKIGFIIKI